MMSNADVLLNDAAARLGVALILGGGITGAGAPAAFGVLAAGIWLLVITIAMAR